MIVRGKDWLERTGDQRKLEGHHDFRESMHKKTGIFSTFIHLSISPGHTYVIRITLTHDKITRYSSDSFSARTLPAAQPGS